MGTARKIASRRPVSTRKTMTTPSMTMTPMPSAHVIPGILTIVPATIELRPRPAAKASGKFETVPMRIVTSPATRAVPATIAAASGSDPPPRYFPAESVPERMMGLRTRI